MRWLKAWIGAATASLWLHTAATAHAADLAIPVSAARTSVGGLCHSRDVLPGGLVCNPAYLPEVADSTVVARAAVSNGWANLLTAKQLLFDPLTKPFLQGLFREHSLTRLGLDTELLFFTPYFAASFMPYRIRFVSEVHNPNYPMVALHAVLEQTLGLATGIGLGLVRPQLAALRLGVALRLSHVRQVMDRFALMALLVTDSGAFLQPRSDVTLQGDVVVAWVQDVAGWIWRGSAAAMRLGSAAKAAAITMPWNLRFGMGVTPPLPWGVLRLGMEAEPFALADAATTQWRAGASYHLGIVEAGAGWHSGGMGVGLAFTFGTFHLGVAYEYPTEDHAHGNIITTEVALQL